MGFRETFKTHRYFKGIMKNTCRTNKTKFSKEENEISISQYFCDQTYKQHKNSVLKYEKEFFLVGWQNGYFDNELTASTGDGECR